MKLINVNLSKIIIIYFQDLKYKFFQFHSIMN
jgi:hypothetical protein